MNEVHSIIEDGPMAGWCEVHQVWEHTIEQETWVESWFERITRILIYEHTTASANGEVVNA